MGTGSAGPTLPSAGLQRETHAAHGTRTAILPVSTVSNPVPATIIQAPQHRTGTISREGAANRGSLLSC